MTNKNNYLKTIGSVLIAGAFLFLAFGSDNDKKKQEVKTSFNNCEELYDYVRLKDLGDLKKDWGNGRGENVTYSDGYRAQGVFHGTQDKYYKVIWDNVTVIDENGRKSSVAIEFTYDTDNSIIHMCWCGSGTAREP